MRADTIGNMDGDSLASHSTAPTKPHDSVALSRFLLAVAPASAAALRQLALDAGLPAWALATDHAAVAPGSLLRLWELLEHALGDPYFALHVAGHHKVAAGHHQLGQLDLFEYLLTTSGTLGEGLLASNRYLPLLTTNRLLRIEAETESGTTYSFRMIDKADTRGAELAIDTWVATWCARARSVTGHPVTPVHVGFAHRAPRSYHPFSETLGTRRIDFGTSATTFTLRNRDLDLPQRGADPVLSRILRHYASTLASPRPSTWHEHLEQLLDQTLEQGTPSLDAIAGRLAVSSRTLQRRLAEHGTTWRADLDNARRRRAQPPGQNADAGLAGLARRIGYKDARSARRALRRWNNLAG